MSVRVAVVQAGAILFDLDACLDKAEQLIAEAAAIASLVVFPEAFVGGYPKGADFGARVGSRTPEGRKLFRRYFEGALAIPGPATARLGEAARAHGVWLVIGVIERAGGTLYCTVLFRSRWLAGGQAPQTNAHRYGASDLGLRRRLYHTRNRD